jgi:hypothetical protein
VGVLVAFGLLLEESITLLRVGVRQTGKLTRLRCDTNQRSGLV